MVPDSIYFGTSTWTYPGWKGTIYTRPYKSEAAFRKNSLEEYCTHPLFRTVGIDSFFYAPPTPEKLCEYSSQVPASFRWVQKVWEQITTPQFPTHKRYGNLAGKRNDNFLNVDIFVERILAPNSHPEVQPHVGPFVFQFPTINPSILDRSEYFDLLANFLRQLPKTFQYAVEIRNPEYLCNEYFSLLNECGVTHCFNHWNYMPPLLAQMKAAAAAGGLSAPLYVTRLLTPANVSYQQAVERFRPYDCLKTPNTNMRADVVRLVQRAVKRNVPAFVIVNNRAEGNAPGTIKAIVDLLQ